jgi:transposase
VQIDLNNLPDNKKDLVSIISNLFKEKEKEKTEKEKALNEKERALSEVKYLKSQLALFKRRFFGSKSEKLTPDEIEQGLLFNEAEEFSELEKTKETVVKSHKRKKRRRKTFPDYIPTREIIHDIPEDEKICSCGVKLTHIGDDIFKEIILIPATVEVIKNIKRKYACKTCEGTSDESKPGVITAKSPAKLLPGTMVTASFLAYIIISKFCDGLPYYRLANILNRFEIFLNRGTMCKWTIKAAEELNSLRELMLKDLLSSPLLGIDETSVQVLKEKGRRPQDKSLMWVFVGYPRGHPIVFYHYNPSKGAKVLTPFLENYTGTIITDGFSSYKSAVKKYKIRHAGCNAHARRDFRDASKGEEKSKHALFYLQWYKKLYALDEVAKKKNLSSEEITKLRQNKSKPIMDKMYAWLKEKGSLVPPKSDLGKAIKYSLNNWNEITLFLEDGNIPIDNNFVERKIKPFVIGRKNWLFSDTVAGAEASSFFYGLIETAKANDLEPFQYLNYLFEKFPEAKTEDEMKKLLPMYLKKEDIKIS